MSRSSAFGHAGPHPLRLRLRVAALRRAMRAAPAPLRITAADVREFLLAYCACFLAVSTFIA